MTGFTNYSADNFGNYITGQIAMPALPAVYLALMTAVGTDAGTGFTEVSGGAYARTQVAGTVVTNGATTTASPTISIASVPSWIYNSTTPASSPGIGMSVYDTTNSNLIGTVLSVASTTVTLTANAAHAITSGDTLSFSAFGNASGTGPATDANGAIIYFPQATASWGTVIGWALYDASSNMLLWDYLGNFPWMPATVSSASPGVITAHAHGLANGGSFVFSNEYGGTAPTFSAGNYTGVQTAAGVSTDTLNVTGVNTSATGNGMIRQITQQPIAINVTASFAASTFTITLA